LKIEDNQVKICELKAAEGARFFEALVLNKEVEDIQEIVSRICGICSCAHSVAAVQALERAMNIKPTEQQKIIREFLMIGERLRSHATHLYFLALPDYYNKESALQLRREHREKIDDALALITLGNKIVELFGGRDMHPFLKIKKELPELSFELLIEELEKSKPVIKRTIELFSQLDYPNLTRETDYLSLKEPHGYAVISGKIASSSGNFEEEDYKKHLKEDIKEYATSKFVLKDNKPYMLGAMARINNNHEQLDTETKEEIKKLNLKLPLKNPYQNNLCQAIEILHVTNKAMHLLKNMPKSEEQTDYKIKEGEGVSAVEAPRGTLFHDYKVNKEGKITSCNIITPTCQQLNMMEQDIIRLVNQLLKQNTTKQEIIMQIEKLIRAYDPCFSCSTHFLKVNWL